MSAIEASSVGVKTMADGTLRITLDIEPRFANDAFGLFGAPGTPCALAALRTGAEVPAALEKPKGGPLARLAGQWCNSNQFIDWARSLYDRGIAGRTLEDFEHPSEFARHVILVACRIRTCADLDHDKYAATRFEVAIRQPYMAHLSAMTEGRATQ